MKLDLRNEPRIKRTIYPTLLTEEDDDVQVLKRVLLDNGKGRYKMPLKDLELSVLDFGNTIDGTHKGIKSKHGNDFLYDYGYDVGLIMTEGNGGPSMHRRSENPRYENRPHQIVQCMNSEKLDDLIVIDTMSSKIPRVYVGLPNKWFKSDGIFRKDQLEKWWKKMIKGDIREYANSREFERLQKLFTARNLNPETVLNVSNISDYSDDVPYLTQSVENVVMNNNLLIVGLGIGELGRGPQEARALHKGWLKEIWNGSPTDILFITSKAHPIAGNKKKRSSARKLDMQKMSKDCKIIKKKADEDTYFLSVPDLAINHTYGTLRNLRDEGELSLKTSTSGCIGFSALNMVESEEGGLLIPETYIFEQNPNGAYNSKRPVDCDLIINPGEKVCVINTGGAID